VPSISPAPPSTNVIDGSEGFFRGLVYRKRTGEIFTIQLNALVMDFALPASLFVATASTPRNEMLAQGPLLEILGAVMLVTYLLWYVFQHQVSKTPKRAIAVQALTVALPNYAAAGLPVVTAILGAKEAVHVAVAIAAGSILPSPLTLLLLELSGWGPCSRCLG
jgi:malonate transporter